MALIFNEIKKYRPVFTGFLLVPWAIAPVVTGYMWRWLFHDSFGLINYGLSSLGFIDQNVAWLAEPDAAMGAVVVANIWRFMPYITIMLLAGLQGVSTELYEAAQVDGANIFQRFFNVTLPSATPCYWRSLSLCHDLDGQRLCSDFYHDRGRASQSNRSRSHHYLQNCL